MMTIFKSDEFIKILRHITEIPTTYYSGGNEWSTWNGKSWNFDCVVSVKSVLWGWCENKNVIHGGANRGSNGVPDFTCNAGLDYCTDVSRDFHNLIPGEYLCMKGTGYDHVGIYLGNGEVFEVTTAWGVDGATISGIDGEGYRYRGNVGSLQWTYHGKLKWIDYNETPKPTQKWKLGDNVKIDGVYVSSESKDKLKPLINHGRITGILFDKKNPYLLNDGKIGWVNDECIIGRYEEINLLTLVKNTIRGDYGNGEERKQKLGEKYQEVQRQVNLNYEHGTTSLDNIRLY